MHSQSIITTLLICLSSPFYSGAGHSAFGGISAVTARALPQHQILPRASPFSDIPPAEVARLMTLTPLQRVAELVPGSVSEEQLQNDQSALFFDELAGKNEDDDSSDSSDDDNDFS